jgi:hypothetical protein
VAADDKLVQINPYVPPFVRKRLRDLEVALADEDVTQAKLVGALICGPDLDEIRGYLTEYRKELAKRRQRMRDARDAGRSDA